MVGNPWQPTTNLDMLQARAELLQHIRGFFAERDVLEVDTPLLASAIGTDPVLDPVRALLKDHAGTEQTLFLQTSPEFPMKRLLAAGSGAIYQLGKAFRNGEAGRKHNPEFTMLEWYRPGFTLEQLMAEVDALLQNVLGLPPATRISYRELFMQHLDIDPFTICPADLMVRARARIDTGFTSNNPDHWLDLLYSHCIEPALMKPVCIHDYPPSQAALAKLAVNADGYQVARRFEVVAQGLELANGYDELANADEQRQRFERDQAQRRAEGLPVYPQDERLLAALAAGLPACCGVAVGVDRLLMLKTGASDIRDVISFPVNRT